uniref:UDENN domain-containing protein n=1 Tax=Denticeps clupeoides TaxID=299321 RepID=A0AAY4D376_9TELE
MLRTNMRFPLLSLAQAYHQDRGIKLPLLDAEVLQAHAPPFVKKENAGDAPNHTLAFSRLQRRRSYMKKREKPAEPAQDAAKSNGASQPPAENLSVPKDIDLVALPQLCFPDVCAVVARIQEDSYHFLVFTDVCGNRTYGVVVQYHRPIQHNNHSTSLRLYTTYGICVISKYPYYSALRDCLSCLLIQLKTCRLMEFEERVNEFSAKLALVPVPPPGQLHVEFSLRPLQIVLPSREDKDRPAVDLDLHLPFLCFRPRELLEVVTCILMEQRMVFCSTDWARLTLVAECLMLYIHPLQWQHPFVPILSRQMLDFVMAPTSFLMGCHIHHIEEIVSVSLKLGSWVFCSKCLDRNADLPSTPCAARDCFIKRAEGLQIHYDLEVCHLGTGTDVNVLRAKRRDWQRRLNTEIQRITLELIVNIFGEVLDHLNYEHRVFNSEEFLRSREITDQKFYQKVLDTHIFHSFLRDRLNGKMDAFTRMELSTRSETHKTRSMADYPRRPTMHEMALKCTSPETRLSKKLGMSLPNLSEHAPIDRTSFQLPCAPIGLHVLEKPIKTFKLPELPPPLSYHYVQNYYSDLINQLGRVMVLMGPSDSSLMARYHYLRGFVSFVAGKRLDALGDFQNLYKTDTDIFPVELVTALVDSLDKEERAQADQRPELIRLLSRVKREHERERARPPEYGTIKKFRLPKTHMQLEDFVRSVQESGIVKDLSTIHRLFDALTVGQQKQVDPDVFRYFYTIWKETEAEAQDVDLPVAVLKHMEHNECVYKLSSSVKTNYGVGKIAMTQRRLFLLTEGRAGYVEITKFRDIEDVRISSAALLLLRIPSLKIKSSLKKEVFEANLKSECDLWNLMVKEMWAGRKMADEHKDPQYMQQALTNALLMDAVVGCLQSQKAIFAASKLAYFDRMKLEVPMMVTKTTSETLKHKINPSLDLTSQQAVDVLLYTPGQLGVADADGGGNPKLWCARSDGKVLVFDAASWSMQQNAVQVGMSRVNCMLGVNQQQLWIGSQDSVIYIINPCSMACNKQLTEHRSEVTGLCVNIQPCSLLVAYSCSAEGTVIVWDVSTLQVRKNFSLSCGRLQSLQLHKGTLWCCKIGTFRSVQKEQLWSGSADSGQLCVWRCGDLSGTFQKIQLPDCTGVLCMIKVKDQIWVGGHGCSSGMSRGKIYVVDAERHSVEKELVAHTDSVQTLSSAEDRYVLSGSAGQDGKIAIWKVE